MYSTYVKACVICTVHMLRHVLYIQYIYEGMCYMYSTYMKACVICTVHI